jgi:hypothetical protein
VTAQGGANGKGVIFTLEDMILSQLEIDGQFKIRIS